LMAQGLKGIAELAMAMWITLGRSDGRPSFGFIVHHTDAGREFRYDREPVLSGQLDRGLDEEPGYGWVLADMKSDWKTVFPPARRGTGSPFCFRSPTSAAHRRLVAPSHARQLTVWATSSNHRSRRVRLRPRGSARMPAYSSPRIMASTTRSLSLAVSH